MEKDYVRRKLESARTLDIQLNAQMLELERLESIATRVTPALTGMPGGNARAGSALENAVMQIVELKEEIQDAVSALMSAKREARTMIDSLQNGAQVAVLRYRYLDVLTWDAIAGETGYSEKWCREMADAGIDWLEENFH